VGPDAGFDLLDSFVGPAICLQDLAGEGRRRLLMLGALTVGTGRRPGRVVQQRRRPHDFQIGAAGLSQPFGYRQHPLNMVETVDRIIGRVPATSLFNGRHHALLRLRNRLDCTLARGG
jgi:hypothetical protein